MKRGFTLVEILTAVFFGAVIILAAYAVFLISYKSYQRNFTSGELTQNGRIALERLSREIRQASEVLTALPVDPGLGAPPSEIKFQDGHNMLLGGQIQYITYYLSGTDLHRKQSHYAFADSPSQWVLWSTLNGEGDLPTEYVDLDQIKAEKISLLQFWGVNVITINLAVSDGEMTYYFQTKALGRNIQ